MYVVRNLRCTVTIDSVLANCKTRNPFLFPVHAMFRHDFPIAVKPASTPERLVCKLTWRDSLSIDMLPIGVTIPATLPQRSEIPEGLTNYPVFIYLYTYTIRTVVCLSCSVFVFLITKHVETHINMWDLRFSLWRIRIKFSCFKRRHVHSNAHKVIAGFFLSPEPEVT
jgi:hypothetical protein